MNSNKRGFESSFDSVENDVVKKVKTNDNVSVKQEQEEIVFLIQNDDYTYTQFGGIKSFHLEEFGNLIYYETLKTSIRCIQKKNVKAYKDINSDSWIYL